MLRKGADKPSGKEQEVEDRKSPGGNVVYAAILMEAREELARPTRGLFWSGAAAGMSMGFSVLGVALMQEALPEAPWRRLVASIGYSFGFLVVILGRQQLFTENTLTPVLPLLRSFSPGLLLNVLRLWGAVLISNMAGAVVVAYALARMPVVDVPMRQAILDVSADATQGSFGALVLRGVFAGWLIALIVWLLPFAESARTHVIVILTYIVALGNFPHVIAGAVEAYSLAWAGHMSWGAALGGFIAPTFLGNVIGGTMLVAAVSHAQISAQGDP